MVGWIGHPLHHSGFPLLLNIVGIFERFLSLWVALAIAAGVALGALTTGLRVLFGVDRPYGGK